MDKKRIYAVISDERRTIYAVNKTELQATKFRDKLIKEGVSDAYVFDNGGNRLVSHRFSNYKDAVIAKKRKNE